MQKILLVLGLMTITACNVDHTEKEQLQDEALSQLMQEVISADSAFSAMSETEGINKAFIHYLADDAVLLRPGHWPIMGDEVIRYLTAQEDTSFVMSWKPSGGSVAASGDLAYTFGIYKVETKTANLQGTYVAVWRRQQDGSWKMELESGNQGLETEHPQD